MLILSSCGIDKLSIASFDAIEMLIAIISCKIAANPPQIAISPQTKLNAVSMLLNLSTSRRIAPLIVAFDSMPSLLDLIIPPGLSSSPKVAEKAIVLLENAVASSGHVVREVACRDGAIRALVEVVEEGSLKCREHAVAILLAMVRCCEDKHREVILREGAMPWLLELSVGGMWRAKEMAQYLLLLLRDCAADYGGRARHQKKKKHELVEQLMEEIDAEGASLRLVEEIVAKLKHDR